MPGILGGLISAIVIGASDTSIYDPAIEFFPHGTDFSKQATRQFIGLIVTLAIAIFGGLLTGFVLKFVT